MARWVCRGLGESRLAPFFSSPSTVEPSSGSTLGSGPPTRSGFRPLHGHRPLCASAVMAVGIQSFRVSGRAIPRIGEQPRGPWPIRSVPSEISKRGNAASDRRRFLPRGAAMQATRSLRIPGEGANPGGPGLVRHPGCPGRGESCSRFHPRPIPRPTKGLDPIQSLDRLELL